MEENREKMVERVSETINELESISQVENMIKDNKIEFKVKDICYRVRIPTWGEEEEANKYRMIKYKELLTELDEKGNKIYLFRDEWQKILKNQNVDIDKMDSNIKQLQLDVNALLLRLAETKNDIGINNLKKEIQELRKRQADISMQKANYLEYSIEEQLRYYSNCFLTYLVLEKKVIVKKDDKEIETWERTFANYSIFKHNDNHELIQKAIFFMNYIIYHGSYDDKG